ncbi:hypothetical protein, partial [Streptomyces sp. NPDC031705]|uniref:hypothetical protein n=1 Tax=Streptomyces sp. NPDC031705 TaxID=3155729 RepID=UPI0033D2EE74
PADAASFTGVQRAAAGMADGSAVVLGIAPDNGPWFTVARVRHGIRRPDGSWTPFAQVPGPNGRDPFPAGQVRVTALRDGRQRRVAACAGIRRVTEPGSFGPHSPAAGGNCGRGGKRPTE